MKRGQTDRQTNNRRTSHLLDRIGPVGRFSENILANPACWTNWKSGIVGLSGISLEYTRCFPQEPLNRNMIFPSLPSSLPAFVDKIVGLYRQLSVRVNSFLFKPGDLDWRIAGYWWIGLESVGRGLEV